METLTLTLLIIYLKITEPMKTETLQNLGIALLGLAAASIAIYCHLNQIGY